MTDANLPDLPIRRDRIADYLPHRDPFLFVDEVTELLPGNLISGYLDVTGEEHLLAGHFPGRPIWPGVLTLEAMAQLWGVCEALANPSGQGVGVFAAVDRVKFRRMVVPGDRLEMTVRLDRRRGPYVRVMAEARVNGESAAEGVLSFGVAP